MKKLAKLCCTFYLLPMFSASFHRETNYCKVTAFWIATRTFSQLEEPSDLNCDKYNVLG